MPDYNQDLGQLSKCSKYKHFGRSRPKSRLANCDCIAFCNAHHHARVVIARSGDKEGHYSVISQDVVLRGAFLVSNIKQHLNNLLDDIIL